MKHLSYLCMRRFRGFTLVELVVVIAVIGVLATLVIASFKGAQVKGRDAQRLSDLNTVRTALESYYNYHQYYPTFITSLQPIQTDNGRVFLDKMPTNPEPRTDHNCPNTDYVYTVATDNKSYSLTTCVSGADALPRTISAMGNGVFQCGDKVTDRDGFTYPTVQINGQCWMAENLKTKTWPNGTALTMASDVSERDCITASNGRGTESDCEAGRTLYSVAVNSSICPTGWHIPSEPELVVMEQSLTDAGQTCVYNRGWRPSGGTCIVGETPEDGCFTAGQKLKAGGSTGFNWQLTGVRNASPWGSASFNDAGEAGYLRTTTGAGCGMPGSWGSTGSAVRAVNANSNGIQRQRLVYKTNPDDPNFQYPAAPIRCIKN